MRYIVTLLKNNIDATLPNSINGMQLIEIKDLTKWVTTLKKDVKNALDNGLPVKLSDNWYVDPRDIMTNNKFNKDLLKIQDEYQFKHNFLSDVHYIDELKEDNKKPSNYMTMSIGDYSGDGHTGAAYYVLKTSSNIENLKEQILNYALPKLENYNESSIIDSELLLEVEDLGIYNSDQINRLKNLINTFVKDAITNETLNIETEIVEGKEEHEITFCMKDFMPWFVVTLNAIDPSLNVEIVGEPMTPDEFNAKKFAIPKNLISTHLNTSYAYGSFDDGYDDEYYTHCN